MGGGEKGRVGEGVRVDVNEEVKFFVKIKKKMFSGSGPAGDGGVEGWGLVKEEGVGWQ